MSSKDTVTITEADLEAASITLRVAVEAFLKRNPSLTNTDAAEFCKRFIAQAFGSYPVDKSCTTCVQFFYSPESPHSNCRKFGEIPAVHVATGCAEHEIDPVPF